MTDTAGEFLRTEEFSVLTTVAPETIRYWRHIGTGPPWFKLGRRVLYRREVVEAWIAEQESKAQAQRDRRAERVSAS